MAEHTSGTGSAAPRKVVGDLVWSLAAMMMLNGAIQLVVYPFLQRRMGVAGYGDMLYQVAIITILGAGTGLAVNNYRLLRQGEGGLGNGDYLASLLCFMLVGGVAAFALMHETLSPLAMAGYLALALCIALRYYSDVEYRLKLNYRGYFLYYAILTLGYLAGLAAWPAMQSWILVLLLGEAACVAFCAVHGAIYRPMKREAPVWRTAKAILPLALSYLMYNAVIQMDRVLLRHLLGSEAVSAYYVASLLGKIIALLVGPLNSVLLSYLSKMKRTLTTVMVFRLLAAIAAVSMVFITGITIVAPWVTCVLYPDIDCGAMLFRANLGQVLCFASSLVLTVLLTLAPSYWQLLSQGLYAVLFVLLGWWGARSGSLDGFVTGTLMANIIRCVVAVAALMIASVHVSRKRAGEDNSIRRSAIRE